MTFSVLECVELSKRFGYKIAVADVVWVLPPESGVVGLVGPNGAGKTTLLKLCAGLLKPSSGVVKLWGVDPRSSWEVFRRVGYVADHVEPYEDMSGLQFLEWSAGLVGASKGAAREAVEEFELGHVADRKVKTFSKGLRQRVKLAGVLLGEPELLLLDEPLNGVDPEHRVKLVNRFRGLADQGVTVVVSSHILSELERMTSRVVAMRHGRLLSVDKLETGSGGGVGSWVVECDMRRGLASVLIGEVGVVSCAVTGSGLCLVTDPKVPVVDLVLAAAERAGATVSGVFQNRSGLAGAYDSVGDGWL